MALLKPQYDTAKLETLKVQTQWSIHRKAVNALAFSPGGKLLASADGEGLLVIHETATFTCIRMYQAAKPILKLVWDPTETSFLYAGCTNGEILKLRIEKKGEEYDNITINRVEGWIHAMAVSSNGDQIVIACGNRVEVIRQKSVREHWGRAELVPIPKIEDGQHPLVRDVHIVSDVILVSFFFPEYGVIAYSSKKPYSEQWRMPKIEQGKFGAGSAVSPSGKRLAVANMMNGLNIYDLKTKVLEENISYDIGGYRYVDVVFVDETTILVGHPLGAVIVITLDKTSQRVYPISVLQCPDPVQTVACVMIRDRLIIIGGSTGILESAKVLMITEDDNLMKEKRKRMRRRSCGCCLFQIVLGLTAAAIIFILVLPPVPNQVDITPNKHHVRPSAKKTQTPRDTARNPPRTSLINLEPPVVTTEEDVKVVKVKPIRTTTRLIPSFRIEKGVEPSQVSRTMGPVIPPVIPTDTGSGSTTHAGSVIATVTEIFTVTETQVTTALYIETTTVTINYDEGISTTAGTEPSAVEAHIVIETVITREVQGRLVSWLEVCESAIRSIFLLGAITLGVFAVIKGNHAVMNQIDREGSHRCSAVVELEKIRDITIQTEEQKPVEGNTTWNRNIGIPAGAGGVASGTGGSPRDPANEMKRDFKTFDTGGRGGRGMGREGFPSPSEGPGLDNKEEAKGKEEAEVEAEVPKNKGKARNIDPEVMEGQPEAREGEENKQQAADKQQDSNEGEAEGRGGDNGTQGGIHSEWEGREGVQGETMPTEADMKSGGTEVESDEGDEDTITLDGSSVYGSKFTDGAEDGSRETRGGASSSSKGARGSTRVPPAPKPTWGAPKFSATKPGPSEPTTRKAAQGKK